MDFLIEITISLGLLMLVVSCAALGILWHGIRNRKKQRSQLNQKKNT